MYTGEPNNESRLANGKPHHYDGDSDENYDDFECHDKTGKCTADKANDLSNQLTKSQKQTINKDEKEILSLITETRSGNSLAFGGLTAAYEPLVNSLVGKYNKIIKSSGGISEPEDLKQEAALALYRAAMSYNKNAGLTFGNYAKICIRNSLISEVRSARIKYLSFDDEKLTREPESVRNPESDIIAEESFKQFIDGLGGLLTEFEYTILRLYLAGKSYKEIATDTKKNKKAVDNALRRIKTKLKGRNLF